MFTPTCFQWGRRPYLTVLLLVSCLVTSTALGQDTVTGAFEGTVTDSQTGAVIAGAAVQIVNQQTGQVIPKTSDSRGRFYQGLLSPGVYLIRVSAAGYQTREARQRLFITRTGEVVPVPVVLDPTPASPTPTPLPQTEEDTDVRARVNASDARQDGAFTEEKVSTLPLGASTYTRTFDELALLLPGVAPPPQTLGSVAGPGVGAGVGSAGQFAVNGLRSRANNFTVDGSDNNDEDIGVRRQGFFSLIPQPIESIQEYQVITLLAPAQFGRNLGAQVNAVSKSGGSATHGTLYGFLNSSRLNARNFFDSTSSSAPFQLREGNQAVFIQRREFTSDLALFNNPLPATEPLLVRNGSDGKDSTTLGQFGFVLGGPLGRLSRVANDEKHLFYFLSAERQTLNAAQEANFVVPNVAQRGVFNTGLTGLFQRPAINPRAGEPLTGRNFTDEGSAILSLFPFPNNPNGIYGTNTFTQTLPASARGFIASGKLDGNFKVRGRQQSATVRYNLTNDRRDIPVTGGALFSSLRSRVRTQNLSTFLNSEVIDSVFNQLRLSYGRTRLDFDELRDTEFLLPAGGRGFVTPDGTQRRFVNPADSRFLLNAPFRINLTRAPAAGIPNTGQVIFSEFLPVNLAQTTEFFTGPVGQVKIGGFSPLGVDVFNFPQLRVNNTYQAADALTFQRGTHRFTFGTDMRRSELNSDLPRNSRPLVAFNGTPYLNADPFNPPTGTTSIFAAGFIRPIDQAATALTSSVFQTLATTDSAINLRFYQLNFFGQDEWRVRRNLSLSYGLRYEYNTPPRETSNRIENTFDSPLLDIPGISGLRNFIGGRSRIFDPDRNNFAPRFGIAYSPLLFGDRTTVIRAGFGIFYDQILGAVVSQSRNVFPSFLTLNTGGGSGSLTGGTFGITNPASDPLCVRFNNLVCVERQLVVDPSTLNRLAPGFPLSLLSRLNSAMPGSYPAGFGATLPARQLNMPMAYHYSASIEQQLNRNLIMSAAYVGTKGRYLLRFATPNLGDNVVTLTYNDLGNLGLLCETDQNGNPILNPNGSCRQFFTSFRGQVFAPGTRILPGTAGVDRANGGFIIRNFTGGGRPVPNVGAVTLFDSTASSRYDGLQLQLRGRFLTSAQLQIAYTLSKATDDVSDVFDLAGAPALPQNSLTRAGERGPANFDARHRFAYNFIYDFPAWNHRSPTFRFLFGGLQIAGTGQYQTGQPFTVNTIFDVNMDGNLTDRLNTARGIVVTGDRRQPLLLTADPTSLLAPIGEDGRLGRNSFRAGNILALDLSVVKNFLHNGQRNLLLRVDIFNFINRANFGVPVRFLEAAGFGRATDTVTPGRRVQIALKYAF